MNLLNFVSQYIDEANCKVKFKEYRDRQGKYVRIVVAQSIIGKKTRNATNAKNVINVKVYGQIQICMVHNFHFVIGL
jgi:hypothetical protein